MSKTAATIEWRGIEIEVRYEPDWLGSGHAHIELESRPRTLLPVTETGYRSRFVNPEELDGFEDAAAFVLAWLNEAAKDWDGQMTLF